MAGENRLAKFGDAILAIGLHEVRHVVLGL